MTTVGSFAAFFGKQGAFKIIEEAVDYLKTREAEATKREYIRAKRDALVTALNHERDFVFAYFPARFAERRESLQQFYDVLHAAVENSNSDQLQVALEGILGIIKDNPLKDLREFRREWEDPNSEFIL